MKIIHVLGELKFSGAEVMLKTASSAFTKENIETTILSTGSEQIGEYSEEYIECSYKVIHIPFRKSFGFVLEIYNLLNKNKYDVVHIHTERFFFFFIVIAKLAGIKKIVRTIHSTFVFTGWLAIRRKIMLKLGNLLGCKYISISTGVQNNEMERNNIKSLLVNNWIDTNYFRPIKLESNNETKTSDFNLISVGACSHVKQHFYILELVSFLTNLGYSVRYLHIGSGELETEEKTLTKKLGIENSVQFLGKQSKIMPFFEISDFFLMPSAYEGLGNSCAEAMAAGVIPLVNDVTGLKNLVDDEINGYVFDFRNIELIANKIISIKKDKKKQFILRENARNKILANYSISNIEKQIELYRN
jgi:glycosyltransferase involved in cell wall biosynthesis